MAYYVACDVKGCDEIAVVGAFGTYPSDWLQVIFQTEADEDQSVQRFLVAGDSRLVGQQIVRRSVLMCPKHDMPEFDPEPDLSEEVNPALG